MLRHSQTSRIEYQIIEPLGEGLNSCVYRAYRKVFRSRFKEEVALKIFKSKNADQHSTQDYQSLMAVHSANCVRVYGLEVMDGYPALVLEYIKGVSLLQLALSCRMRDSHLLYIVENVKRGLDDIHRGGLLHGDVSPQNILIDIEGRVKLIDFGLSNFGDNTFVRATPEFVDPKVLKGELPDAASDFYALNEVVRFCSKFVLNSNEEADLNTSQWQLASLVREISQAEPEQTERRYSAGSTQIMPSAGPQVRRRSCFRGGPAFLGLLVVAGMFFPSVRVQSNSLPTPALKAYLHIRTHKWYRLRVNSREVGYAPVSLTVREGKVFIEWSQNRRKGRRSLTIKGGENIVLSDSFFKSSN